MLPPNVPQCRYIKPNGRRCGSPALRGQRHCYFHYQVYRPRTGCQLPPFEDANSVQFGLIEVARALLEDQINQKKAALLAYILQTAAYNLKDVDFKPWWEDMVRELPRQPRSRKENPQPTAAAESEGTAEAVPAGSDDDGPPAENNDQAAAAPIDPHDAVANAVAIVRAAAPRIAAAQGWPLPDELKRGTG